MLTKTSDSSKGILQNTSYSYISQMAQWQNEQSLFEYTVREKDNKVYGEDLKISNNNGVFVRVSK